MAIDTSKIPNTEIFEEVRKALVDLESQIDDVSGGGAGVDADTLDGQDGTYYLNYNNFSNTPTIPTTTSQITEGSNLYHTTTRVNSVISATVNQSFVNQLNVDADTLDGNDSLHYLNYNNLSNKPTIPSTTDQITEGSNLYYTNARADARVSAATGANLDLSSKSTTDLSEGNNLYYTNARADARVNAQTGANLDLSSKSTTDLSEGTNLYFTNARADARITNIIIDEDDMASDSFVKVPTQQSVKAYVDSRDSDDITEGSSNLYHTTTRVNSVISGTVNQNFVNQLNVDAATLNDQQPSYYLDYDNFSNKPTIPTTSDDLTEGSTNLFFTNARADARVTAATGSNLDLSAKSTDDLSEGTTNLYYTDARADARIANNIIDEDTMSTNSETRAPSQQSVKAYVDSQVATKDSLSELSGDTDDIAEGSTNLYHTAARVRSVVSNQLVESTAINIATVNDTLEISADVRNLDVSPIVDGLAYYTDITNYFNSNNTTIGFLSGGTVNEDGTISGGTAFNPSAREIYFVNGTGIDLTYEANDSDHNGNNSLIISAVTATTSKRGIIRLANNAESNNSNVSDRAITPAGLAYALSQNISTPNLQNVTDQGNVTEDYIGIGDFDLLNNDNPLAPLHIRDNDTLKVILDNNSTTKSEIKFSDSGTSSTSLYVGTNDGFGYVSQNSGNLSDAGISIKQTNGNVGIGVAVDDTQKLKVGGALLATGNISSSLDVIAVNVDASGDVTAGANITLDASEGTVFATNADFSGTLTVDTLSSLDGGVNVGDNFNISNTGTITGTGAVWQGSVIASAYLDDDTAHLSGVQTFSGAKTFSQNVTALDFVLSGSDRKLKTEIQAIEKDSFDFEFKQYKYKGKDDLRYGVIAQDIEEKYPEFVKETEDGIKTVSYIDLLVAKVAELENRIKELENANT